MSLWNLSILVHAVRTDERTRNLPANNGQSIIRIKFRPYLFRRRCGLLPKHTAALDPMPPDINAYIRTQPRDKNITVFILKGQS